MSLYQPHAQLTGELLPITYTLPPMYDEVEEPPQAETNKRKKAIPPSDSEQN